MRSSAAALFLLAPLLASAQVGPWGQCGGRNHNGQTTCVSGHYCRVLNEWYSQCVPGSDPSPTTQAPPPTTTSVVVPPTTVVPPPTTTTGGSTPTGTPLFPAVPSASAGSLQAKARAKGGRYFGTACDQNTLSISQISNIVKAEFGMVTPENSMKWDTTESSRGNFNLAGGDYLVNWAMENGKQVRGHTLVWHSQLPGWVSNINDRNTLISVIENHINTLMGRWKGKIAHWDVVNEVLEDNGNFRNSVFYRVLGEEFIAIAFRAAKKADPVAKLYINDYNLDYQSAKLTNTIALVNRLKNAGVPIDGIGSQGHLIVGNGAVTSVPTTLKQLHDVGLDVAITELDIRMQMPSDSSKLQQQARDYTTVVSACVSLPRCVGVSVWGIDDGHSWVPSTFNGQGDALLWTNGYQKKPAYDAVSAALN